MKEKKTTKATVAKKTATADKKTTAAKTATKKTVATKTATVKTVEKKAPATKATTPKTTAKKVAEKNVETKPAAKKAEPKTETKKTAAKKPAEKKVGAEKAAPKETKTVAAEKKVATATKTPAKKAAAPKTTKSTAPATAKKTTATKKVEAKPVEPVAKVEEPVVETPEVKTVETPAVVEKPEKKKAAKKAVAKKETKPAKKKPAAKKKAVPAKKEKVEETPVVYQPSNFTLPGYNDLPLNIYVYDNTKNPKAVIVLLHGMQEHSLRYKAFAEYLNKNDFIVVASDLRGHGLTAPSKDALGVGENDIFSETINDQLNIINEVSTSYNLPIYLFGHSYGSILSQKLIQCSPIIEKAVLCGTASGNATLSKLGNLVINIMSPFKNHNKRGGFVEKLCIKSYGKKFENGNWLTKDEEIFKAYQEDEYCGGSFPFSFYKSMLNNLTKINNGIAKVGNKKIFFIAGDQDPVNNGGKDVVELHNFYLKNNIDSKIKIYKNDRHEILNETDKAEVWQDVVEFFNF